MTSKEVIKAMECCYGKNELTCEDCPMFKKSISWCKEETEGRIMDEKTLGKYIIDFSKIPYDRKLEERALYPFPTLNFLTGGMELGEISILGGETGSGKTTACSMFVSEIIKHDKCFCVYGESTIEKQAQAHYRQMTPYNENDYLYVNYYKDGKKTNIGQFFVSERAERRIKEQTEKKLFYYDPKGGMDINSIMEAMKFCYEKGEIKYFVLDNLMQLSLETNDEVREMKDNFEQLRRFVIDNKVHCIVLAHYRKSSDYGVFRRRLEEIAGTSAIGNKCATALNIMRLDNVDRDSKYSKAFAKLLEKNGYDFSECDAVIEVLKTRHNKLGFVGLKYDKKTNTYYESRKINNNQEESEKAEVVVRQNPTLMEIDDDEPLPF